MTHSGGEAGPDLGPLLRRLRSRRAAARAALLFERLWPAIWPAAGVAGIFVCLALLGLPERLPPWPHLALLAGFSLTILAILFRAWRSIALPDQAAADRRLERDSNLPHRPLAALADRPVGNDAITDELWQAHLLRAGQQIQRLQINLPKPGLAAVDRHALRVGLAVALVACLVIAGPDAPALLIRALTPALPRSASTPDPEIHAWITPPAYTRLPPVFLKPTMPAIHVPAGAQITVNVTGGRQTAIPTLLLGATETLLQPLDRSSFQVEQELLTDGRLSVRRNSQELAAWNVTIIPDQPPTIAWADRPGPSANGPQLRLPWQVADDYGVVSLQADLILNQSVDPPPATLQLPLPLPGDGPAKAKGITVQDLSSHPWAGLSVRGRLTGRDAVGQTGESTEITFPLPERLFRDPIARRLIALRRHLTLHPRDRDLTLNTIGALLPASQPFGSDLGAHLNLAGIYFVLADDPSPMAIEAAQQRMWQLAVRLEEGQAERITRTLEAARQAARDTLDRATRLPDTANLADLNQKLAELEDALRSQFRDWLEQAKDDSNIEQINPQALQMDANDLQRLTQAARDAAKAGQLDEVQQRIAELEDRLDQIQHGQSANAEAAQQSARQRAEMRQRGKKQMDALQDMIARQGSLLDHAQQRIQERTRADHSQMRATDQRTQQALRDALADLMRQFGNLTEGQSPSLSEAEAAMREAEQALESGTDPEAASVEQRAIEALQQGGQELSRALAEKFEPGNAAPGNQTAGPLDERGNSRDPLGRRQGTGASGPDDGDDVQVPEQRERQRAQAIEEELRRRGAERSRPPEELDYIDRLLKRF